MKGRSQSLTSKIGIGALNGRWEILFKFTMIAIPMLVTVGIGAQAWILNQLNILNVNVAKVSERISVVEANRFSSGEGMKVWEAISDIKQQLAKLPEEVPPQWVADKLNALEDDMKNLNTQVLLLNAGKKR